MPAAAPAMSEEILSPQELRELWPYLSEEEQLEGILALPRHEAEDLFLSLGSQDQADLVLRMSAIERRAWVRLLPPDDAADVLQLLKSPVRDEIFALIDEPTQHEVSALMAYREDAAGGLMSPRYGRLPPDMRLDEAISYLRQQAQGQVEMLRYIYVLDDQQHLLGVVAFRELFAGAPEKRVREIMRTSLVKALEDMDQQKVSRLFAESGLWAIPVVDGENRMKGIITIDDIVDVVREEDTKEIQRVGGTEALDAPYLKIALFRMIKKRAGWLSALFLGEMLTATAMGYFEGEIAKAVVLALFVPLIISSGGNSGSQATTLVIRAMALQEVRLRDWFRVIRRELTSGFILGCILGSIGFLRIMLWQYLFHTYGKHPLVIGMTVAFSLVGVVTFGTLAGSMLPFILKKLKFDPASASAPFVATLVDVTGLVIYFTVASIILKGVFL